jgi:hypothetical protein
MTGCQPHGQPGKPANQKWYQNGVKNIPNQYQGNRRLMDNNTPIYKDIQLLYVVSLDPSERVYCQHPGCNRTVYAKVHITRLDDKISFVGSTCFKKLFGHLALSPTIGGSASKLLSSEERQRLVENTEAFLSAVREANAHRVGLKKAEEEAREQAARNRWQQYTSPGTPTAPTYGTLNKRPRIPSSRAKLRSIYGCFK